MYAFQAESRATTDVVLENNLRITRSGECVFDAFVKHYVNKMDNMDHNIHWYSSNNQVTHGAGHSFVGCEECPLSSFAFFPSCNPKEGASSMRDAQRGTFLASS